MCICDSVIAVGKQVSKLEHAPFLGNPIFNISSSGELYTILSSNSRGDVDTNN